MHFIRFAFQPTEPPANPKPVPIPVFDGSEYDSPCEQGESKADSATSSAGRVGGGAGSAGGAQGEDVVEGVGDVSRMSAEDLKKLANTAFSGKDWDMAETLYSKAIDRDRKNHVRRQCSCVTVVLPGPCKKRTRYLLWCVCGMNMLGGEGV